jgi:hypothetical protein
MSLYPLTFRSKASLNDLVQQAAFGMVSRAFGVVLARKSDTDDDQNRHYLLLFFGFFVRARHSVLWDAVANALLVSPTISITDCGWLKTRTIGEDCCDASSNVRVRVARRRLIR